MTGGAGTVEDDTAGGRAQGEPTGIPGLDAILGGGVPRGSLVLLVGPPGSGKTTMAAAMAFAAAKRGRRVVVLTGLSEASAKLIAHLRSFAFFDDALVGDQVQVLSLTSMLVDGVPATADQLVTEMRRRGADLVVLDGFRTIDLAADTPLQAREFLYAVGGGLGIFGTTTLITAESHARTPTVTAEATGADILLTLSLTLHGVQPRRTIEVVKVRGAAPWLGLHSLAIAQQGVSVCPRLEARVLEELRTSTSVPLDGAGAPFALPELDALIGGGLTRGTATLVLGSPGTGKTLLGLHFALSGIAAGEPAVVLGFHEDEAELHLKATTFGLGEALRRATGADGGLTLLRVPPIECDADKVAHLLLEAVDRTGARRVVIDSIVELERAVSDTSGMERRANYLAALTEAFRRRRVTALFIKENGTLTAGALSLATDLVSVIAANVLWLQQVAYQDRLVRVLSVPKMRFSAHDTTLREFVIAAPNGLVVRAPFQSEGGMLTALARSQGPGPSGS